MTDQGINKNSSQIEPVPPREHSAVEVKNVGSICAMDVNDRAALETLVHQDSSIF